MAFGESLYCFPLKEVNSIRFGSVFTRALTVLKKALPTLMKEFKIHGVCFNLYSIFLLMPTLSPHISKRYFVNPLKQHEMLWSPFQPPERYRPHYLFILACISTSSFLSTQASRPSVLSLKKTSFRHKHYFRIFLVLCKETTDVHTAALHTMCLSHIFLPETIEGKYVCA